MAVVPMQKISLLVHCAEKAKILAFLQKKGILQITNIEKVGDLEKIELGEESHDLEYKVAELDFAINFLKKYENKKKGLQAMIDGDSVETNTEEFREITKNYQFEDMVERCQSIEEEMVNLKNEIKSITSIKEKLLTWQHFNCPLNIPPETDSVAAVFIGVLAKNWADFQKEILSISELVIITHEKKYTDKMYAQIICDKTIVNQINIIIINHKAETIELPHLQGTPVEELKRIDIRLEQIKTREDQLIKVAKDFAKELKQLRIAYDYYSWELQKKNTLSNFAATESTIIINGWMPQKGCEPLEKDLQTITDTFVLSKIEPDENEHPPVLLQNKGIMKPFQSVTDIYGLPLPNELDPTPYLAIFFIVFYGLALTDAVYGLIMFASLFVALKYLKIPKQSQGLLKLLMYAGIVTFVMGVLYGGWASLEIAQAPSWLTTTNATGEKIFIGQKINAIKNPITVLILSLALGYIQVLIGVIMNFVWQFKTSSKKDAMLDSFPWVYILLIIGLAIIQQVGLLPAYLWTPIFYMLMIGVGLIVLTQGRKKDNIVLKFLSGVISLYDLVGYLSDVLSYSRLLALGLTTAIIGLAVNTVAGILIDQIPYIGIVLAIVILIVGHIFNIGINALGAFIHSGRLQFVEFFTKFLEGGGAAFKPLKRDSKYIQLKD